VSVLLVVVGEQPVMPTTQLFVAYRIRADLLARDYNDLIAMPPPVGNTPHTGSIRRPR
jgi:hypothetical protein